MVGEWLRDVQTGLGWLVGLHCLAYLIYFFSFNFAASENFPICELLIVTVISSFHEKLVTYVK